MSLWGYGCAWRMQDRDLYAFAGAGGYHRADGFTARRVGVELDADLRALQESWRETIQALYVDGLGNRRAP